MKRPFGHSPRGAALALLALAACGSSNGGPVSIGPAGGTVTSTGGASVSIPAGALGAATAITATNASSAHPPSTIAVGAALTLGPEGQQFASPVTVTLPFSPGLLPAGKTAAAVVIYTAPAGTTSFAALTTSTVDATHVSAQVSHFSIFVPAVPGCVTNADCLAPENCVNGACTGSCVTNSDCPSGQNCVSGLCK